MDLTPCSPNIWKTQETRGAPVEKEGTGDPTGHSFSHVRTRRHNYPPMTLPVVTAPSEEMRGCGPRAAQKGSGQVRSNHAQWRDRTRGVLAARPLGVPEESESSSGATGSPVYADSELDPGEAESFHGQLEPVPSRPSTQSLHRLHTLTISRFPGSPEFCLRLPQPVRIKAVQRLYTVTVKGRENRNPQEPRQGRDYHDFPSIAPPTCSNRAPDWTGLKTALSSA